MVWSPCYIDPVFNYILLLREPTCLVLSFFSSLSHGETTSSFSNRSWSTSLEVSKLWSRILPMQFKTDGSRQPCRWSWEVIPPCHKDCYGWVLHLFVCILLVIFYFTLSNWYTIEIVKYFWKRNHTNSKDTIQIISSK